MSRRTSATNTGKFCHASLKCHMNRVTYATTQGPQSAYNLEGLEIQPASRPQWSPKAVTSRYHGSKKLSSKQSPDYTKMASLSIAAMISFWCVSSYISESFSSGPNESN